MELYNIVRSYGETQYILKITGNSRIRIINDFESNLIKQKYINFKPDIHNSPVLYLTTVNLTPTINKLNFFEQVLITFVYKYGMPYISDICNTTSSYAFRAIYPTYPISDDTCKMFNINKLKMDIHEYNEAYQMHDSTDQTKKYNEEHKKTWNIVVRTPDELFINNSNIESDNDTDYEDDYYPEGRHVIDDIIYK
jgi:hypothetical protein